MFPNVIIVSRQVKNYTRTINLIAGKKYWSESLKEILKARFCQSDTIHSFFASQCQYQDSIL